jgi:nucleoside-diphosphate-sugar epimerase
MDWRGSRTLVTGGASFIGSHLVDSLVDLGADVTVVDDLSSGRLENIRRHLESDRIRFQQLDLRRQHSAESVIRGHSCVFHLAADHGGRGYIETHEAACAGNVLLDGIVFESCVRSGVERVVYASSACVYPRYLQQDARKIIRLREDDVGPPFDADGMYGWAKLIGEKTLATLARKHAFEAVSCRYFTAFGPRATESHAVMAMIARALIRQEPFEVWGTGEQLRNWTFISDIVAGTLAAADHASSAGEAFNIGTMEGTRVLDAAAMILERAGLSSEIVTRPDMPTGPYYRVADNTKLAQATGWTPSISFAEGLEKTMDWYFASKSGPDISKALPEMLLER